MNQIILELSDSNQDWETDFHYLEIPYFLTYAYSLSFSSKEDKYRATQKNWNAEYDNSRFNLGIYNIDRLAILEKTISIGGDEIMFLNSIDKEKLDTTKFEEIVLDGFICELTIPKTAKHLKWNTDEEMNYELAILINWIRKKVGKK